MAGYDQTEVSIIMPCLNEAETLEGCIENALKFLDAFNLRGEIIVVDNGSTDGSGEIAKTYGVHLVQEARLGYGNAYLKGFSVAQGSLIVMIDADGSYDINDTLKFLNHLHNGQDFVVGSRLKGNIFPGAMPWLHRYIGVPILTLLLNQVSGCNVSDAHCGLRAIKREALEKLNLHSSGMEFASEILIKAAKQGLTIVEIPVSCYPRKGGQPKLRTIRDGWRHLRLLVSHLLDS